MLYSELGSSFALFNPTLKSMCALSMPRFQCVTQGIVCPMFSIRPCCLEANSNGDCLSSLLFGASPLVHCFPGTSAQGGVGLAL